MTSFLSLEWVRFPAEVAAILAQVIPVLYLTLVLELRAVRRAAKSRGENKGLRLHINVAFVGFLLAEITALIVVGAKGITGEPALVFWLVLVTSVGTDMITLLHLARDD